MWFSNKNICRDESLEDLANGDHIVLCVFVTNLLLRVKKQRVFFDQLNKGMAEWLQNMGLRPEDVQNFEVLEKEILISSTLSLHMSMFLKWQNVSMTNPLLF